MLDDLKKLFAENRLKDEAIYAHVLAEMESGYRRDGLWAKALADAKFDEKDAKSRYIKLRVQSVKDEITLLQIEESRSKSLVNGSPKSLPSGVPPGSSHTDRKYSCNNCEYFGHLVIRKTGLLGGADTFVCPKCGNRGSVSPGVPAGSIPAGSSHTEKKYSCNNCDYYGQLLQKKTGLFGQKNALVCPKCGNRGSIG